MAELIEYPSPFPLSHRPVTFWDARPRIFVDHRMSPSDEQLWMSRVDAVIRTRAVELHRNVLIHSVSYARAKSIMALSRYRDRMIWHDDSNGSRDAVAEFKQRAGTGAVLVSPSMGSGVNFPDDECRCILIPKLPYPDMRSPIMQRIQDEDSEQRDHIMIKSLVQNCGRGNRHGQDWCEAILIDAHCTHALRKLDRFAPRYFRDAVRTTLMLPPPLQV